MRTDIKGGERDADRSIEPTGGPPPPPPGSRSLERAGGENIRVNKAGAKYRCLDIAAIDRDGTRRYADRSLIGVTSKHNALSRAELPGVSATLAAPLPAAASYLRRNFSSLFPFFLFSYSAISSSDPSARSDAEHFPFFFFSLSLSPAR